MHLKSQILVKFSKVCILVHVKVSSQFLGCEIFASCGLRSLLALVIGRSDIREMLFSFSSIMVVTQSAILAGRVGWVGIQIVSTIALVTFLDN